MLSVDPLIESQIRSAVKVNESFLWVGKPRQGMIFLMSDLSKAALSMIWCVACYYIFVRGKGFPFPGNLIAIPFFLVGFYLAIGRFFFNSWKRKYAIYGVTASRVVFVSGSFFEDPKILAIKSLHDIDITEHNNGSGTIQFDPYHTWLENPRYLWKQKYELPKFEFIENSREVYYLVHKLKRSEAEAKV